MKPQSITTRPGSVRGRPKCLPGAGPGNAAIGVDEEFHDHAPWLGVIGAEPHQASAESTSIGSPEEQCHGDKEQKSTPFVSVVISIRLAKAGQGELESSWELAEVWNADACAPATTSEAASGRRNGSRRNFLKDELAWVKARSFQELQWKTSKVTSTWVLVAAGFPSNVAA